MLNLLHKLLHPHCRDCQLESVCQSCETLKSQLEIVNREKKQLLDALINPRQVKEEVVTEQKPIQSSNIPWRIRAAHLEAEDRAKANSLRKRTDEIEKEVGLTLENDNAVG